MKQSIQYIFFSLFCIGILKGTYAQTLQYNRAKNCWGISMVSTRYAPIYLSWYHINGNLKSFGLKAGAGYANRLGNIYYYPFSYINYKYQGHYVYATPIWMPYRKVFKHKSVQFTLAVPLGFSQDKLTRYIQSDPLFQGKTFEQQSNHFYSGIEFEAQFWFEISSNLLLTTGLSTGFKTTGQMPFQKELSGILDKSYYYSGMYAGKYMNFNAGIAFYPFKK